MATVKYFSDNGSEPVELKAVWGVRNAEFAARFPGVRGRRMDSFSMLVGQPVNGSGMLPVTRSITYKSNPSKHECNAKCMGGKHNGACECRCGGANHGRGMFASLVH